MKFKRKYKLISTGELKKVPNSCLEKQKDLESFTGMQGSAQSESWSREFKKQNKYLFKLKGS